MLFFLVGSRASNIAPEGLSGTPYRLRRHRVRTCPYPEHVHTPAPGSIFRVACVVAVGLVGT